MNEEILRIQKMVADGKITPEEGEERIASVGNPASPPANQEAAAPPTKKSDRKEIGIIALCALGLALPSCLLAQAVAVCLIPLSIILGFIAWRTTPGKVAAIGGLLIVIGVPIAFGIFMIYGFFFGRWP